MNKPIPKRKRVDSDSEQDDESTSPHAKDAPSTSPHAKAAPSTSPHAKAAPSTSPHAKAAPSTSPHAKAAPSTSPHAKDAAQQTDCNKLKKKPPKGASLMQNIKACYTQYKFDTDPVNLDNYDQLHDEYKEYLKSIYKKKKKKKRQTKTNSKSGFFRNEIRYSTT